MSSTRGYLTDAQYQQITAKATLGGDADAIIGRAEAIIDGYIGNWQPAVPGHYDGAAVLAAVDGAQIASEHVSQMPGVNYLKGMVIEWLSGDAEGQYRVITSQDALGNLTFDTDFSNAPAPGDIYHIYQMGKAPRAGTGDLRSFESNGAITYVKTVPAALREAVAWQVAYMQELGAAYFDGSGLNMASESFGKYSYQKGENATGGKAIIAPKARQVLAGSGIINRTGNIRW